jgi:uncharacterized repeat protein (TIGR03803 family)
MHLTPIKSVRDVAFLRQACERAAQRCCYLPTLIAVLGLILVGRVSAQTLTPLHSFTGGKDGAWPQGGLILSGDTLYGTASGGGSAGKGTVFAVNTDGTGFTNLHSFTAYAGSPAANSDGASPQCGLILSGNTLFGTAYGAMGNLGINASYGTVFSLSLGQSAHHN